MSGMASLPGMPAARGTSKRAAVTVTSAQVLNALRNGPYPEGAFAWNYEVRNGTGYRQTARYADAIVVSCYPSRGLWVAGIECKVSRSDWKRELETPAKSAELQKWCTYWWVAAPEGVVELHEVPPTWGLFVVTGNKVRVAVKASRLTPEPLTIDFVASLMRKESEKMARARAAGDDEGYRRAQANLGDEKVAALEAQVRELSREKSQGSRELDMVKRDLAHLRSTVAGFERSAGLAAGTISRQSSSFGEHPIGPQFKAACLLAKIGSQRLSEEFRSVADALAELEQATKEAVGT